MVTLQPIWLLLPKKSGDPPNIIHLWAYRIPCHLLIQFLARLPMVTFILGDLVYNQVGSPLISQPMRF